MEIVNTCFVGKVTKYIWNRVNKAINLIFHNIIHNECTCRPALNLRLTKAAIEFAINNVRTGVSEYVLPYADDGWDAGQLLFLCYNLSGGTLDHISAINVDQVEFKTDRDGVYGVNVTVRKMLDIIQNSRRRQKSFTFYSHCKNKALYSEGILEAPRVSINFKGILAHDHWVRVLINLLSNGLF